MFGVDNAGDELLCTICKDLVHCKGMHFVQHFSLQSFILVCAFSPHVVTFWSNLKRYYAQSNPVSRFYALCCECCSAIITPNCSTIAVRLTYSHFLSLVVCGSHL